MSPAYCDTWTRLVTALAPIALACAVEVSGAVVGTPPVPPRKTNAVPTKGVASPVGAGSGATTTTSLNPSALTSPAEATHAPKRLACQVVPTGGAPGSLRREPFAVGEMPVALPW